ncbi:alpha-E domain-containing protein [Oxalobacteraceae bacterium]|nr:alpha-E domain-containing protein [Oxalobacteraceae bacterium]
MAQRQSRGQGQLQRQSQGQSQSQGQGQGQSQGLPPLAGLPAGVPAAPGIEIDPSIQAALLLAVVSPEVPGLARCQQQLLGSASQLRERLAADNWRALTRMGQRAEGMSGPPSEAEAMRLLDEAVLSHMNAAGFALDGMCRDLGWRFLSLGRRIERLQFESLVLQRALDLGADDNLDWLLELFDSSVTYRARYRAQPEWLPVLDLLLLDASNPRSIMFQVAGIMQGLERIAQTQGSCGAALLAPLHEELLALDPGPDLFCGSLKLKDLMMRLNLASAALAERISLKFFSYTGKPEQEETS